MLRTAAYMHGPCPRPGRQQLVTLGLGVMVLTCALCAQRDWQTSTSVASMCKTAQGPAKARYHPRADKVVNIADIEPFCRGRCWINSPWPDPSCQCVAAAMVPWGMTFVVTKHSNADWGFCVGGRVHSRPIFGHVNSLCRMVSWTSLSSYYHEIWCCRIRVFDF